MDRNITSSPFLSKKPGKNGMMRDKAYGNRRHHSPEYRSKGFMRINKAAGVDFNELCKIQNESEALRRKELEGKKAALSSGNNSSNSSSSWRVSSKDLYYHRDRTHHHSHSLNPSSLDINTTTLSSSSLTNNPTTTPNIKRENLNDTHPLDTETQFPSSSHSQLLPSRRHHRSRHTLSPPRTNITDIDSGPFGTFSYESRHLTHVILKLTKPYFNSVSDPDKRILADFLSGDYLSSDKRVCVVLNSGNIKVKDENYRRDTFIELDYKNNIWKRVTKLIPIHHEESSPLLSE